MPVRWHQPLFLPIKRTYQSHSKEVIVKEKYNPIEQDSPNPLFDCYEGSQLDMNICSSKELA
ncbi:hypothetical protein HUE46_01450 [Flavobacterium columnare]|uniref:Uncharacterized protein n=1 Tax=Flavobacterium columnare TaxID=996 RepID=A0AA94F1Y6_9FLAO|nr:MULTISPECIES: hypothetical protein [Flavobacterium]MCH4828772.1 hypothetical protein [Flavobacterium columnare]MCH4832026.1 hypothetical protein [Flavobacterium columnare]QOG88790.1 hypothetical protein HUE41_01450 [Flavobacterium columnare]QOG91449.1 hypothetical protein HUE42_01445 [Flavobacterium columnare]QOG94112.1 hypothetical protein HUE43_01450 [Flavobacterium columnare]